MGTIEKTDVELVEASRRGELEAFGHLVARYQDVVCAVGFSSTGDRVLGEDVAQETFVAAWRQLDRVRDAMRIGPWLCGIARNLGRKARKRTWREQLGEPDDQVAATPSAFDQLARGDSERIVREALGRVPETYREVLVLYYQEDQSIREVATALGISEDAVMQRLSRGRRYLADSVTSLVERSLRGSRPRRDLVAAVLAAIAIYAIPSRVDASTVPTKGSTMLKLTIAASALAVAGAAVYLTTRGGHDAPPAAKVAATPLLHYGNGPARAPALGPTAPRHMTAARQTAVGDLGWLPADSDFVVGMDMARIKSSALWQQFVAPGLSSPQMQEFVSKCGFDPIASLTEVSMGFRMIGDGDANGTIVVHGVDKTKFIHCLTSTAPDIQGITVDGDVVMISGEHKPGGIVFVDATTALVVIGPAAATKAGLQQVAAGGSGLEASPDFAALYANINTDDPLWWVVGPSSPIFGTINSSIQPFTSVRVQAAYGSIDVNGSLVIQAGARLGSPAQVASLVDEARSRIDRLAAGGTLVQYFDQLDINGDGSDVIVSVSANALQLMNIATSGTVHADATAATPNAPGSFEVSASLGGS